MGMSIREDIGALFAKYHLTKTALGVRILQMNKEKGWLIPLLFKSRDLKKNSLKHKNTPISDEVRVFFIV